VHFTAPPVISLEEAVSIYLNADAVRRATATDMANPAAPVWSASNDLGKNFRSLSFTYYATNGAAVSPDTLANRNAVAWIDIHLTVQTANALSNRTQPTYSLALRTIPRNLILRSAN